MKSKHLFGALKLLAFLWVGITLYANFGPPARELAKYEARADSALAFAARETQRANTLGAVADSLRTEHEAIVAQVDERAPLIRERIRTVTETLPPDTVRDPIIHELVAENDALRTAYTLAVQEADTLRLALMHVRQANDSLTLILEQRPTRKWWVPRIVIGPGALLTPSGTAHAGLGITLGWEIRR